MTFEEETELYWEDQWADNFPELDAMDELEDIVDNEDEWYEEA